MRAIVKKMGDKKGNAPKSKAKAKAKAPSQAKWVEQAWGPRGYTRTVSMNYFGAIEMAVAWAKAKHQTECPNKP